VKFLALKTAFEQAGFTGSLPAIPEPPLPPPFFLPAMRRQTVVGSGISRDPIDRLAARVTAKAPWWAKPPVIHVSIPLEQPPKKRRTRTPKSHARAGRTRPAPAPLPDGAAETVQSPAQAHGSNKPATQPYLTPAEALWRLTGINDFG